jgi:3-mercaptopyruvate sulfurtransferase SseA
MPPQAAPPAKVGAPVVAGDYAHPDWLVDGSRLRTMFAGDPSVKVVALGPPDDFAAVHISGAAQIDWPDLEIVETSDQQIATWRAEVEQKMTALGLSPSDSVVIYDPGKLYTPRLWWILDQLGHPN